ARTRSSTCPSWASPSATPSRSRLPLLPQRLSTCRTEQPHQPHRPGHGFPLSPSDCRPAAPSSPARRAAPLTASPPPPAVVVPHGRRAHLAVAAHEHPLVAVEPLLVDEQVQLLEHVVVGRRVVRRPHVRVECTLARAARVEVVLGELREVALLAERAGVLEP